jgi:hypothetical protein
MCHQPTPNNTTDQRISGNGKAKSKPAPLKIVRDAAPKIRGNLFATRRGDSRAVCDQIAVPSSRFIPQSRDPINLW